MAGIQRFITYIYLYEEGKKGANNGFAKIELRGNECRMEIHLRELYGGRGQGEICLFREREGKTEIFRIGKMPLNNGKSDWGIVFRAEKINDSAYHFRDMEGLIIRDEDGRIWASRWKEGRPLEIRPENIEEWEPMKKVTDDRSRTASVSQEPELSVKQEARKLEEEKEMPVSNSMKAERETEYNEQTLAEEVAGKALDSQKKPAEELEETAENLQATELPMKNIFPQYQLEEVWENMSETHQIFPLYIKKSTGHFTQASATNPETNMSENIAPNESKKEILCLRMELKDLREFPKKYWYMGNNSFLLHGFFNYRYLVFGKLDEDQWMLGVPGVYQQQERVMAAIFGFPEFIPEKRGPQEQEEEKEPYNRFGYWCHIL